jgi:hypothetical protein
MQKVVVHTDLVAVFVWQVDRRDVRTLSLQVLRKPYHRTLDGRLRHHVAIKDDAHIAAIQRDIIPIIQERHAAEVVLALKAVHAQHGHSAPPMRGERVRLLLTFGNPQRG